MEKFTWEELAKAIDNLPPDFKQKQVQVSFEDESIFKHMHSLLTIENDIYVNEDNDEDCASLEDLKELHGNEFKLSDYRLATQKGTPYLWDGF